MYKQKIELTFSERAGTLLNIINFEEVPSSWYCRFDSSGNVNVTVYTVSEDGCYMIAEADSDHTAFMLLKVISKDGESYVTEYVNHAFNPMDEMYSRLSCVHWYEEYGFCKLEFFNMDFIPLGSESIRRIYFK